jgi:cell division protein FtsB
MADKKQVLKHKKELYYIFLIVVVGGILLLAILGPDGYLALENARLKLQQQKASVDALELSNRKRAETNEALRKNPEAIERYAREKGGYGRENEIIQQLPENSEEEPESGSMKE